MAKAYVVTIQHGDNPAADNEEFIAERETLERRIGGTLAGIIWGRDAGSVLSLTDVETISVITVKVVEL